MRPVADQDWWPVMALQQLHLICSGPVEALGEVLEDMAQRGFAATGLKNLDKDDGRLLALCTLAG